MSVSAPDRQVLRDLAAEIMEIAALPINDERRRMFATLNDVKRTKPLITIFQEPWNEMDVDGELQLRCEDPALHGVEGHFRRTLYKWRHMQGDMIVDGLFVSPYHINDTGFGINEDVDVAITDATSDVVSRHFHIQIASEADLHKIRTPEISHDAAATERSFEMWSDILDGVMPVARCGLGGFWFAPWDELVRWTGVEEILMAMQERPAFVHAAIGRLVDAWMSRLDQLEAQDLLACPTMQMWGVGAAQIFSAVSPAMHEEFALRHEARWFDRFGHNYYGCCEPLDLKVDILRRNIPRLRRISMSPFIDFDRAVRNMGDEFIFAWKPNPAIFAGDDWDPDHVRADLREKMEKARGCVIEVIMKDISTVRYHPQRLWEWATIAAEVTTDFA
jgi:hypothetical protein